MTCFVPSDRVIVPRSLAVAPVPAVGAPVVVSGGHAVAHPPEHVDLVLVSGTHRYRDRPELSVRKLWPLLLCTSTVAAADPPAAADDADDAGEAGVDGELLEPPELQAAARTAAAARGRPTRSATDAFLDENRLLICCDCPFEHGTQSGWNSGALHR